MTMQMLPSTDTTNLIIIKKKNAILRRNTEKSCDALLDDTRFKYKLIFM